MKASDVFPFFLIEYPIKFEGKVEPASNCNHTEELVQKISQVNGENETIFFHQINVHVEEVDVDRANENDEYTNQGN